MDGLSVRAVPTELRGIALALLFSHTPVELRPVQVREALAAADAGELCLDGLLLAERNGVPVGAALYVLQPGRVAFVWPPIGEAAGALLTEVGQRIDAAGARVGQCLLDPSRLEESTALEAAGFVAVTELEFLHRDLNQELPPPPSVAWQTEPLCLSRNRALFVELLERTTAGTLDCPELNGICSGDEVFEGHRACGEFDPDLWTVFRVDGRPVGVLVAALQSERAAWEIVYMGVLPEARGRGYGHAMLASALHLARGAGRSSVFLAVDRRNVFARAVYEALGFVGVGVQTVHLRLRQPT